MGEMAALGWGVPLCGGAATRTTTERSGGVHVFATCGWAKTKGLVAGECLRSDRFHVGGVEWCVELYPAGVSAKHGAYLGCRVRALGRQALLGYGVGGAGAATPFAGLSAEYEVVVVDQAGGDAPIVAKSSEPAAVAADGRLVTLKRLVSSDDLERRKATLLAGDALVVRVTLTVSRTWTQRVAMPAPAATPLGPQHYAGRGGAYRAAGLPPAYLPSAYGGMPPTYAGMPPPAHGCLAHGGMRAPGLAGSPDVPVTVSYAYPASVRRLSMPMYSPPSTLSYFNPKGTATGSAYTGSAVPMPTPAAADQPYHYSTGVPLIGAPLQLGQVAHYSPYSSLYSMA